MPVAVLVGAPGSGKTTVGRALAARLHTSFRDTDEDIEARSGALITELFIDVGEAAFRALERAAVAEALASTDGVLALGGGSVTDATTRARLVGQHVVYLDVTATTAGQRVGLARSRPLLLGNVRAQLRGLLEARRPLYEEVATVTVDTEGRTPEDIAALVLTALEGTSAAPAGGPAVSAGPGPGAGARQGVEAAPEAPGPAR